MDNEMMKDLQARMRACTTKEEAEEIMVEVAKVAPPLPIDQIEIFTSQQGQTLFSCFRGFDGIAFILKYSLKG